MNVTIYEFTIDQKDIAQMFETHFLFIPDDVAEQLGKKHNTRVELEINGCVFRQALQKEKLGRFYVWSSKQFLKTAGLKDLQICIIKIWLDPDPDRVDVGEAFQTILDDDPLIKEIWEKQKPAFKRGLAHYMTSGKTDPTRAKRAIEIAERLLKKDWPSMLD